MRDKRPVDELSIEELERILAIRKREERERRLRRMRETGRVIEPAAPPTPSSGANAGGGNGGATPAPIPTPPVSVTPPVSNAAQPTKPPRETARPSGSSVLDMPTSLADLDALLQSQSETSEADDSSEADTSRIIPDARDLPLSPAPTLTPTPRFEEEHGVGAESHVTGENPQKTRKFTNRLLLLVEVAAVVGLFVLGVNMLTAITDLQNQTAEVQREAAAQRIASIPTPEPTSIIQVKLEDYLLPGGHTISTDGEYSFNYDELEQFVPAHLRDTLRIQVAQSIAIRRPQITAEDAERLVIDKLRIDQPIVAGADDEALKQGVGRVLNGALPGNTTGNVILAAHNDVYGELFRDLQTLEEGDRFVVQTRTKTYEYEVIRTTIVAPDKIEVMEDQGYPSVTLITCITQRTVNDSRLVVLARRLDATGF